MNPKISVLIPVYNTAKFLPACLNSVLSQSMPDFEIVAVNDASTDDSARILAKYAAGDSRVRVVNHEKNQGLLGVRKTGIRAARTEYIMFLDSDDCLLPGVLKRVLNLAESRRADIVNFPMELRFRSGKGRGKLIKYSLPYRRILRGKEVFRKYFQEDACSWMLCQKMFRTELCRKTAEYIPDDFCLMGEDFCFYTICSFFAECYVPLKKPGYVYYLDSGISSGQKTTLEKFLGRQSPFQALRNVKNFLIRQGVRDEYQAAFEHQEQKLLGEYVLRWMRHLPDGDRTKAFNGMLRKYDAFPLFQAFRTFFSDKDELFLEMLSGDDPEPVSCPEAFSRIARNVPIQEQRISSARWKEWEKTIRENHYDAVLLEPDEDLERLFWDIQAIRSSGAAAVCQRRENYLNTQEKSGLNVWLMEDRVMRQASLILVPDEDSVQWYRKRNCHAGISLQNFLPPQKSDQISAFMLALEKSEQKDARYRLDPGPDGETFVPFFRKLDRLFRKLPDGFRKKTFGALAGIYNRMTGN